MADLAHEVKELLERGQRSARSFGASVSYNGAPQSPRAVISAGEAAAAADRARCVSEPPPDPILLSEPCSVRPRTPGSRGSAGVNGSSGDGSGGSREGSSRWGAAEPSAAGGTSSTAGCAVHQASAAAPATTIGAHADAAKPTLSGVAALEAYRRQWCAAGGGDGGQAAAKPLSAAEDQGPRSPVRTVLALRSRPGGCAGPADFGPGHQPGCLPDPAPSVLVPNTGMGRPLVPPRMRARSCAPPPGAEPLLPVGPDAKAEAAQRDALRIVQPEDLVSRVVYDSLVPPDRPPAAASEVDEAATSSGLGLAYAPGLEPWYLPESPDDTTLVFESRFETGNLRRAIQVRQYEYDLVLQPDINTRGHTQWFFFSVSNTCAGQTYRFNIINMLKDDSLYNHGMLPLVHSERQLLDESIGWARAGSGVCYYPNSVRRRGGGHYYNLSFALTLPHSRDTVHVAHCYPFTFTDLQQHLAAVEARAAAAALHSALPARQVAVSRETLCLTLAGNPVDLLTITAGPGDAGAAPLERRLGVVLSARVHPGETNSSWMMKGAIDFLTGPSAEAAALRGAFVFKVVPMLNPDGVVVGNYRCCLAGLDLNREYREPGPPTPNIRAFKEMARAVAAERGIVLMADLHGHSRKMGVFAYGCDPLTAAPNGGSDVNGGGPVAGSVGGLPGVPETHQARLFPLMLQLNAPDKFSYRGCNFAVQKAKAGTGRVVGFRELGLVNALTVEASFCGPAAGRLARAHFNAGHLEQMGAALVRTLCDYFAPESSSAAWELLEALELVNPSDGGPPAAHLVHTAEGLELVLIGEEGEGNESEEEASDEGLEGAAASGRATDSDDESSEEDPRKAAAVAEARAARAAARGSGTGSSAAGAAPWRGAGSTSVAAVAMALVAAGPAGPAVAKEIARTAAVLVAQMLDGSPCVAVAAVSGSEAALSSATLTSAAHAAASPAPGEPAGGVRSSGEGPPLRGAAVRAAASQLASAYAAYLKAVGGAPPGGLLPASGATAVSASSPSAPPVATASKPCSPTSPSARSDSNAQPGAATAGTLSAPQAVSSAGLPASGTARFPAAALEAQLLEIVRESARVFHCAQAVGASGASASPVAASDARRMVSLAAAAPALTLEMLQFFFNAPPLVAGASPGGAAGDNGGGVAAAGGATHKAGKGKGGKAGKGKKGRRRKKSWGSPEILRAHREKADAGLAAALPMLGSSGPGTSRTSSSSSGASSHPSLATSGTSTPATAGRLSPPPPGDLRAPATPAGSTTTGQTTSGLPNSFLSSGRTGGALEPAAGRRAYRLDAGKYLQLASKQRGQAGGVLEASALAARAGGVAAAAGGGGPAGGSLAAAGSAPGSAPDSGARGRFIGT